MSKKLDTFKMEAKFEGLIKLLAEGLYSEPDIFLRELIQNAHDSIVRRKALDPDLAGRIEITFNVSDQTIVVRDNGIGMDEQDIRQFLSVIGTGFAREQGSTIPYELIGQFGIGMLSAFVVADKVYVDTLKEGTSEAFEWRNYGSEDCQLYSSEKSDIGSTITVYVSNKHTYLLNQAKLKEIIIKYCDIISVPIILNGEGPVNAVDSPWNRTYFDANAANAAYHAFIDRRFTDYALDVFPIDIPGAFQAKGILYISDRHIAGVNTGGSLDIFIRKMLVKKDDTALLPSWAKFVRGVIDSPDLKPTAARDNIQMADPSFEHIKTELGKVIVERLTYLAQKQPDKFKMINDWHHDQLKGMAFAYDDFFQSIAGTLLFETNKGMLALGEYLSKNDPLPDKRAPIYYFSLYDSAAQYYRLANARDITVINAGRNFDEELLNKYAKKHSDIVALQQFDIMSEGVIFSDLTEAERTLFAALERVLTFELQRNGLNVTVKAAHFLPESIPALTIESARTKAEEDLRSLLSNPQIRLRMSDTWDDVIKEQRRKERKLVLNAKNPIIKMLTEQPDDPLHLYIMAGLYNNALLYSHHLREEDMTAVHDCMVTIMQQALRLAGDKATADSKIEELRTEIRENSRPVDEEDSKPDHIRIFMITPFDDSYRPVEEAVRAVLEAPPFFCEVRLARDYTNKGGELLGNVREHIAQSHGFIAEISDLNPNVMLEVGGILMRKDERPVFSLRSKTSIKDVPADLKSKLYIPYGAREDGAAAIQEAIAAFFTNPETGHPASADMEELKQQRKKRFLSKTLLSSLSDLTLSEPQKRAITSKYQTVEALVAAEPADIAKQTGLRQGLASDLREVLQAVMAQ